MSNKGIKVTVTGGAAIAAKLQKLGGDVVAAKKAVLWAASEVVASAARSNVQAASPTVANAIRIETLSERGDKVALGVAPARHAWIAHFIEHGTAPHRITVSSAKAMRLVDGRFVHSVNHPGVLARPFMRPALDEHRDQAFAAAARVAEEIVKAA